MQLYSTKNRAQLYSLEEAVLKGLPDDNGLFMPQTINKISPKLLDNIEDYTFSELAYEVCACLLDGIIPEDELKKIINSAVNFPAPIVDLDENIKILELFHGPSLAFKDFGARFMAQIMSYFNRDKTEELVILVATSGDTGGAVAAGFLNTPGIRVIILYPSGKVSMLQEKQLTTLGNNITALEVQGTFDDCQTLVKKAFLDKSLTSKYRLSSANSINIARLIPQTFYYFEAYKQLKDKSKPLVFCVPSGNFGNITAGIIASKMGLPVDHFIAATNLNDIVPSYLSTGNYTPRPSVPTLSNAMDVGNPSNFARMQAICSTWNIMKSEVSGYSFSDEETKQGIKDVYERYNYVIDPHGAVGYLAIKSYMEAHKDINAVVLETAHPSKFKAEVEKVLNIEVEIPERLAVLANKKKEATLLSIEYNEFHSWLNDNL